MQLRVSPGEVAIWTLGADPQLLAVHARASHRDGWIVDEAHWDGLPDGAHPNTGPAAEPQLAGQHQLIADHAQPPVARGDLAALMLLWFVLG